MGVDKYVIHYGNGTDYPKKNDEVSMEYTGWLYDENVADKKGTKFDSSVGRGDLMTQIGVGRVIRGWDEGILGSSENGTQGMSLGEKSTLTISSDYGYGARGFPGHIPANAKLIL
ncbi:peptidyl-prolyl cis-trans isomerase [Lophiostoma macrostomum CBS 122681]|uniref:peptidylprolyl isomerase n=1 Tax=Lophiostoma macrostomum CBS 122681 TaxID=1314788 RepID=A0A6A6SS72_9PLEO|nr:peptidyl-prolyl cis-trans isomerase [Lophiostoma macrostomum CBS 122681]